jgi:hypothetical protein
LIEQFLGKNFLFLSRQRENFWQTFDDHLDMLPGLPGNSIPKKMADLELETTKAEGVVSGKY